MKRVKKVMGHSRTARETTMEQRPAMISSINQIRFREYSNVGWLKADAIKSFRLYDDEGKQLLSDYTERGEDSLELRLAVIRLFLHWEMCNLIPESSCAIHVAETPLKRITASEAMQVVDAIIAVSNATPQPEVDYAQLREWFFDKLFAPDEVQWFSNCSAQDVQGGGLPAVIGLDKEIIAMFWLE